MAQPLGKEALDQLFLEARSHNKWLPRDVPDSKLREIIDLANMGPTSANCEPARFVFVRSPEAKQRLSPHLSEGNRAKTLEAPVCAIIGYDTQFYEHLAKLFPHNLTARSWFEGKGEVTTMTMIRNGTLQGAYFILAARALGVDTGPMSGFDNAGVDREFFPDGRVKSNFLCCVGYGDPAGLFGRSPRFTFDEVAKVL